MTQRVEARFHCDGMDLDENGTGELQMSAMVYEGANAHFTEATPNGSIEMAIDGEKTLAAHYFEPGKVYRVIFEELTEDEDARERERAGA